jgi:predicted component of type VI protein secretion system
MKAGLLEKASALKSAIMAHLSFQELQRNHTVVERRVFQKDGGGLGVRVMNATVADVRKDFADAGNPELGEFYQAVVSDEYHRPGGKSNRVVHLLFPVGPNEVDVVDPILDMGNEAHFVVVSTARPEVVLPDADEPPADFAGLTRSKPGQIASEYQKPENAPLHALNQDGKATKWVNAVGLANARKPFHPRSNPCPSSPQFKESNGPLRIPVSALASEAIARSYTRTGNNGSRISGFFGGGRHTLAAVVEDGEVMTLDCVLNYLQEQALHRCGLYCVLPWKRKNYAVGFDSVAGFVPVPTGDDQADANAVLASKVAYTMLSIEFGHLLKKELDAFRGLTVDCDSVRQVIESRLNVFVTPDIKALPKNLLERQDALARKPLARVEVKVTSSTPGVFHATADITPHTLLAGAHVTLKVKAEVSPKKS